MKVKVRKTNFILVIIVIAILTAIITGTYAIYKMTVSGKVEGYLASVIADLQTSENSKINICIGNLTKEYNFSVNNYITEDSVTTINQVECNYYIKIDGITSNIVSEKLYYINSNNEEIELTKQALGTYAGYYIATEKLGVTDKKTDKYVLKMTVGEITANESMNISIDLGYTQCISDTSEDSNEEANAPKTTDGMIPIKWDDTNDYWVKADNNNTDNDWYDYTTKKWANVAYVKESGINTRSYYEDATIDTKIENDDIIAMYVWIPRFVYKIPSTYYHKSLTEDQIINDTLNDNLIEVHFSKGTDDYYDTTMTIYEYSDTTHNASDNWMTSSAFEFANTKITGFWMAKFQASRENNTVYILPAKNQVKNISLITILPIFRNMESNTIYGWQTPTGTLNDITEIYSTDTNGFDTHLVKNSEWSAIAYLAHSKYGKNKEGINLLEEAPKDTFYTGFSDDITTVYTTNSEITTTGNVYGIYDMESTMWDCVSASVGTGSGLYSTMDSRYKDVYTVPTGVTYTLDKGNQASVYGLFEYINGATIWDTSGAVGTGTTDDSKASWYKGRSNIGTNTNIILVRGGAYTNNGATKSNCSIFAFGNAKVGDENGSRSFRPVITIGTGL